MMASSVSASDRIAPRQRIAAERAEAHAQHLRLLAGFKRQALVVHHDQRAVALDHGALLGEIERHHGDFLGADVVPHVELGPVGQRENPHRFAGLDAGVEDAPQLGPLVARVPAVAGRAVREDALLGAAFFLVAAGAAEGGIEAPFVHGLAQAFGLHDLGMDRRTGGDRRDAALEAFFVDMDEQIHAEARRGLIAERDHLAELPGRVDMQKRKRRLARRKGLLRDVQHRARILADRIEHDRIGEARHRLAHDVDGLGLEPAQLGY